MTIRQLKKEHAQFVIEQNKLIDAWKKVKIQINFIKDISKPYNSKTRSEMRIILGLPSLKEELEKHSNAVKEYFDKNGLRFTYLKELMESLEDKIKRMKNKLEAATIKEQQAGSNAACETGESEEAMIN